MISLNIKGKNNKQYIIKIDEDNFKKEMINERPYWTVRYEVYKQDNSRIGHGNFSATCSKDHEHISDDQMLNVLIKIGNQKIRRAIDNGENIESKGYNLYITDCTK